MGARIRHVVIWTLLRPFIAVLTWLLFGFRGERVRVKGPFLLLCNHNADWDPLLLGVCFPQQTYFVSSEHLLRHGLGGRLVSFLQAPIPRQKGGNASGTVLNILRKLRRGWNVGLFPEGNRSWDGVTRPFPASTGKLIHAAAAAGASLVTYRIEGGYFSNPRWAGSRLRRGKCVGRLVHIYAPEDLKGLRPEALNALVAADLHEDAYERQRSEQIPFRGSRLAEHMETLLFLCPRCGGVHTLHSAGDSLTCEQCGLHVRYLPTGFLEGDAPWDNLRDWNVWQEGEIARLCRESDELTPIFTDTEIECYSVETGRATTLLGRGEMALYADRLELPGITLPAGDITGMSMRGAQDLYVGTAAHSYLLRSDSVRCLQGYITALSCLTGGDYGV